MNNDEYCFDAETARTARVVKELRDQSKMMAALVKEELEKKVPSIQLEQSTGKLLINPGVCDLVIRAESILRQSQCSLGRIKNRVQNLVIGASPAVWDHDEEEKDAWTGEPDQGGPSSPGDGLKVLVMLAGEAEEGAGKVLQLAVGYHLQRKQLGRHNCRGN